jgi:hypothetical protein
MEENKTQKQDRLVLTYIFGYPEVMFESEYASILRDRDLLDL